MKYIVLLLLTVVMMAYSKSKPEPPPPEEFLTLADVSGRPTLVEDSPDVRVIVKTKSFIKQNDLRTAKAKAVELANVVAAGEMVRELLPPSTYNENYEKIEDYLSRNTNNYVDEQEVVGEHRIFIGQYYGISAAFKLEEPIIAPDIRDLVFLSNND